MIIKVDWIVYRMMGGRNIGCSTPKLARESPCRHRCPLTMSAADWRFRRWSHRRTQVHCCRRNKSIHQPDTFQNDRLLYLNSNSTSPIRRDIDVRKSSINCYFFLVTFGSDGKDICLLQLIPLLISFDVMLMNLMIKSR